MVKNVNKNSSSSWYCRKKGGFLPLKSPPLKPPVLHTQVRVSVLVRVSSVLRYTHVSLPTAKWMLLFYDRPFWFVVCHLITEMFATYNRWRCRCLCRALHGMEVAWRPGGTDPVKIKILKTKFKALRETTFLHTSNDITLLVEFMIETLTL